MNQITANNKIKLHSKERRNHRFSFFMFLLFLFSTIAFILGSLWGKKLADRGITSDNALLKHQIFFVRLIIAIAFSFLTLIIIDRFNLNSLLPQIIPHILLIYLAGWYHSIIFVAGFFILGLLIFLEINGKYTQQKINQLILGISLISFVLSVLGYFLKPIDKLIQNSQIIDGVVMQTTFYTCAPSAIATLARATKKYPQLTEQEAIKYTRTNRFGTTTLNEINALKELQFNPEYKHNLMVENLFELNRSALLHVKERNKDDRGVRFSHAVALLATNQKKQLLLIGNPYYGLQIKTVAEMKDYWFGEAIFINGRRINDK